jgi:hypothetical protein
LTIIPLKPALRLGFDNPIIDLAGQRLLARCREPVAKSTVEPDSLEVMEKYFHTLFLIEISE